MKKFIMLLAMMLPLVSFAQNEQDTQIIKFEIFLTKKGQITKLIEDKMPSIPSTNYYKDLSANVVTLKGEEGELYFLLIELETTLEIDTRFAVIPYTDLVKINKALKKIVNEVGKDTASNPDYLINSYTSDNGFQVGYYVKKGKAYWFIVFNKDSKTEILIKNSDAITNCFTAAEKKMDELKAK